MSIFNKRSEIFAILKYLYTSEGSITKVVSKIFTRFFQYVYYKSFRNCEFELNNRNYKYFYSLFNVTFTNERAVEIPIVMDVVWKFSGKEILEVGNVLGWYYKFTHDVVDKYDKTEGVINQDIVDYKPCKKYNLIISISTLEHVGWDETPREKNKISKAVENMASLLSEKGRMLVTMPLGYNKDMDTLLEENKLEFTHTYYLKRISKDNRWKQVHFKEVKNIEFGFPHPWANGIVIGILEK